MRQAVLAHIVFAAGFSLTWETAAAAQTLDSRLVPWQADVAEAAIRFDMPTGWINRVILAESGGQTVQNGRPITSEKGAMGLMQLMPGTYEAMRARYNLGTDPFDPHDNILAGTAYLRAMFDRFGYPGLFAAYNAGPTRFEASLSGLPLPLETQDYLRKTVDHLPSSPVIAPLFVPVSGAEAAPEGRPSNALFVVRWTPDAPPNLDGDGPAEGAAPVTP
jgi:soluble lytic murein transglycosylase-like protein